MPTAPKGYEYTDPHDPCWIYNRKPPRNGWYDVCTERRNKKQGTVSYALALCLWRNGKWIEAPLPVTAWREPMIEPDTKGSGKPMHPDGFQALLEAIALDYMTDYKTTFELRLMERIGSEKFWERDADFQRANDWIHADCFSIYTLGVMDEDALETHLANLRREITEKVYPRLSGRKRKRKGGIYRWAG